MSPRPSQGTMLPLWIGIDPGQSGGLVSMTSHLVIATRMPLTERDIWNWFDGIFLPQRAFALIENVHSMPGQGVSSSFKFGQGLGFLRACLVAKGIRFDAVTPRVWQKALGIPPRAKTESKPEFKNRLKAKALQLFPGEDVTLSIADALLIAEYCRRTYSPLSGGSR